MHSKILRALLPTLFAARQCSSAAFPDHFVNGREIETSPQQERRLRSTYTATSDEPVTFYVTADSPYTEEEARKLQLDLTNVPYHNGDSFVVHLGDVNDAFVQGCSRDWFQGVRQVLLNSKNPLFMVPGNHDVRDCPDGQEGNYYEAFEGFNSEWNHTLGVIRQRHHPDNFSLYRRGVLFVGLNIVKMHHKNQRKSQKTDDLRFVLERMRELISNRSAIEALIIFGHELPDHHHEHLFLPLIKITEKLGLPLLYIHGDHHVWELEEGAFGRPNFTRVQVAMGKSAPPTKVTVYRRSGDGPVAFEFDRRKPPKKMLRRPPPDGLS